MNVYLIGMMGSGKSVTGRKLAELAGYSFVDLDDWIQKKTRRTIPEIFRGEGEDAFRKMESEWLAEVSRRDRHVVATGGGVVLDPANVSRMKETGTMIYLEASGETLWERVREKGDRPLLGGKDPKAALFRILGERRETYEKVSHLRVATDGQTAEAVARKILELLPLKL